MGFFANRKRDKEDQLWLEGADFTECLELLFGDTPDDDMKRRIRVFYRSKKMDVIPSSQKSVWATLMHYHNIIILPKMEIVASNISHGVYMLICEAGEKDPYEAKGLFERLFQKWPEALPYAIRAAAKEELERNLVFLACVNLFGWCADADVIKAAMYAERLNALGPLKEPAVYEWLKTQIKK